MWYLCYRYLYCRLGAHKLAFLGSHISTIGAHLLLVIVFHFACHDKLLWILEENVRYYKLKSFAWQGHVSPPIFACWRRKGTSNKHNNIMKVYNEFISLIPFPLPWQPSLCDLTNQVLKKKIFWVSFTQTSSIGCSWNSRFKISYTLGILPSIAIRLA